MGREMALGIQCTPLVVHSVALETRKEVEKAVLPDSVLRSRLWQTSRINKIKENIIRPY